jgi:hypothetical protein
VPRFTIDGYELPASVRKEFDYLEDIDQGIFFKYRGDYYDLGEFMLVPKDAKDLAGWDGYAGDSFFSGVVVKFADDSMESVICGLYLS